MILSISKVLRLIFNHYEIDNRVRDLGPTHCPLIIVLLLLHGFVHILEFNHFYNHKPKAIIELWDLLNHAALIVESQIEIPLAKANCSYVMFSGVMRAERIRMAFHCTTPLEKVI